MGDVTRLRAIEGLRDWLRTASAGYAGSPQVAEGVAQSGTIPVSSIASLRKPALDMLTGLKQHLQASVGYLGLIGEDDADNLIIAAGGWSADSGRGQPRMPLWGAVAEAFRTCSVVIYNDVMANSGRLVPEGHPAVENLLVAPISMACGPCGVICVSNRPGGFSRAEADLASFGSDMFSVFLQRHLATEALGRLDGLIEEREGLRAEAHELRASNEALLEELCRKSLLIKEIHHRVKNNLTVVHSLLKHYAGRTTDKSARQSLVDCQNRIMTMSLIHERLYLAEGQSTINISEYLKSLSRMILGSYATGSTGVDLTVDVPDLLMDVAMVMPCGLIVNELISNSLKHGFPEGGSGGIRIGMEKRGKTWTLTYSDTGDGFPEHMDLHGGGTFGMHLIESLVQQMRGKAEFGRGERNMIKIEFEDRVPGRR